MYWTVIKVNLSTLYYYNNHLSITLVLKKIGKILCLLSTFYVCVNITLLIFLFKHIYCVTVFVKILHCLLSTIFFFLSISFYSINNTDKMDNPYSVLDQENTEEYIEVRITPKKILIDISLIA